MARMVEDCDCVSMLDDFACIHHIDTVHHFGYDAHVMGDKNNGSVQLILEAVPFMDKVRLVNSGTEAVMSAIRVARGYTGRDKIIKFRGNYHGHSDGLLVTAGSGLLTESNPDSAGVPKGYTATTLLADYNDEASVEALFKANPGEIAAIIVEPVSANMGVVPPKEGFLQFLRDITKANDSLLIFDEVITGFRLAFGGASEYFGIQPDMITFGKTSEFSAALTAV